MRLCCFFGTFGPIIPSILAVCRVQAWTDGLRSLLHTKNKSACKPGSV